MQDKILRKFFLGFIQIHILHHAKQDPIYGAWMLQELHEHGYEISPGTLYPILRRMESGGLLDKEEITVDGKVRKYYRITALGEEIYPEARKKHMSCLRK